MSTHATRTRSAISHPPKRRSCQIGGGRRTRRWLPLSLLALAATITLAASRADAAGLLIAQGGFGGRLEIVDHDVRVTINNGIAVTTVTQVFRNLENRQVEALYTFPVPEGASVSNFSMWIGGKEMIGEVLEKERAREIYDTYKAQRVDPGLLEQKDYKTFEMRIFPINANAEQRVQITYYQELDVDHDRATYVYPLATVTDGPADTRVQGRFSLELDVQSLTPIAEMDCPSHGDDMVIVTHDVGYRQASLEVSGGELSRDVVLSYALERPQTGFDFLCSRDGNEDGTFCLVLSVGEDLEQLDVGMDYVFLLDISGSMTHDGKLATSTGSLSSFVEALGEKDRLQIITFNASPTPLFPDLQPVNPDNVASAQTFVSQQSARGGTRLVSALELAFRYGNPDRPLNVVLLSDGMTEAQNRASLLAMSAQRPKHAKIFCIGVGNEVNKPLLEQLARDAGGLAAFVSQEDSFRRQAKAFRRKLTRPAATDVKIEFGSHVYDVVPEKLPNLYHGSPIRVYGRYRGKGEGKVAVTANIAGRKFDTAVEVDFPAQDDTNPEIERMWAMAKIHQLLGEADRRGDRKPVIGEVIALGEEHSIVTEYTSFLVLENDGEYDRWKIERRNLRRTGRDRAAQAQLAQNLEQLRAKAVRRLGPGAPAQTVAAQEEPAETQLTPVTPDRASNRAARRAPAEGRRVDPQPERRRRGSSPNFGGGGGGFGGGPVGPVFVGLGLAAYAVSRRRRGRGE